MLNVVLSCDITIPPLGIYPKEMKHRLAQKLEHGSLFIIAKRQKQPKCPSTDKWINDVWYVYTMGYYSTTKKEILICGYKMDESLGIVISERI